MLPFFSDNSFSTEGESETDVNGEQLLAEIRAEMIEAGLDPLDQELKLAQVALPQGGAKELFSWLVMSSAVVLNGDKLSLPEFDFSNSWIFNSESENNDTKNDEGTGIPDIAYPGNDPTVSPGADWEWRGAGNPTSGKGSWYNPETGESLHPDLEHPDPIGPHWDYKSPDGTQYRVNPDGTVVPK